MLRKTRPSELCLSPLPKSCMLNPSVASLLYCLPAGSEERMSELRRDISSPPFSIASIHHSPPYIRTLPPPLAVFSLPWPVMVLNHAKPPLWTLCLLLLPSFLTWPYFFTVTVYDPLISLSLIDSICASIPLVLPLRWLGHRSSEAPESFIIYSFKQSLQTFRLPWWLRR